MHTHSSSNLPVVSSSNPSTSNPKRRNRRRSKQPFILEESPIDTMADQRTMAELLHAPTKGYAEAIVVPPILTEKFELKHSLINMMIPDQFFRLEKDNPHDHIRWGSPTTNLRNEISNLQQRFDESFHEAWDRYKDLLRAYTHHGFTELHQLDTFYNALNPADQNSLNAAAGGNFLERRTQDVLTIIENKSKVRNSRNKSVVSQVKSCDANSNSSSEIAKLTHAVNQQTSDVTTAMTSILKQFQATPPPASVKAVEEICVTCGDAHLYYQCLAAGGNTLPELRDNIQGYVSAAAVNYNQGNSIYRPLEETLTDPDLSEYTIKVPPPLIQKYNHPSQREYVVHQRDPLHPNILYPSRMLKQKQQEKDEYQKMLKALLSNKEKLQELANTPLNENCSAVILKKLPENLGDPGKFLISCGFSELKCKALADLGVSINLMPLSVWRKLGLPELISTRMTLKLANRAICTPAGIARDVFVSVGKFTFPADFVIVDYKSDPRVPLILGRPFLRTARALIDVHDEEMILRDGDERLTLNMRHDTSSYSNQPQKESINLINVFNDSKGGNVLPEKLLDLDSTKDLHLPLHVNPLSGSTTYSSFPNQLLEEFTDELALITFPPKYDDDLQFDVESDLKEIEFLLHQDIDSSLKNSIDQSNPANNFVDSMPEMFTDEHAPDYSFPPIFDEYDDDFLEVESDTENVYDDPFDSKKIKESKLLIDELDLSCDFLPPSEYDSFISQDFSRVDAKPSTNNEDKDFDPLFYEPLFFKEVPRSKMLLLFSSENEEKVFKPGIHTSK
uniref:Reverse transcriptase domain-containing protein n=1 Tax=Tanacetum cinerariifolium TaxID=118510 RepID=A0A6L2J372_TANCI|nr:reverse transcriptase domain-containing protein [Tanacetum cinerariifolium]